MFTAIFWIGVGIAGTLFVQVVIARSTTAQKVAGFIARHSRAAWNRVVAWSKGEKQ